MIFCDICFDLRITFTSALMNLSTTTILESYTITGTVLELDQ